MVNVSQSIEQIAIEKLIPYAKNSRTHSDAQVAQVSGSIKEFGFTNPVLIDQDGVIIAGHGRVLAARKLGMIDVPCIRLTHLSDAQKRAYVIADNKLALNAGWDDDLLSIELKDLQEIGFDLGLTGFTDDELNKLMPYPVTAGLTDEDDCPEVAAVPISKLGDVWLLGKHRLMCGDSSNLNDVEKLCSDNLVDLVFTDPPYNVAYSGLGKNKLGTIKNDDMSVTDFEQFCRDIFTSYFTVMKPLAIIYVCHPDSQSAPKLAFEKTFAELFKKSSTIIWMKQSAGMGWQDYRAQHEPILYGWKEGKGSHFYCGDRSKTTVWKIGRDAAATYVHPTQKPVALPVEAIENSSKGSDIVLDLFGGSGSTLIACEKTGRINRSMELDEKYVDVIVKRWQNFTGGGAILEGDGRTFNEIAENETRQNTKTH
jgi:DNA modification methylase